MKSIAVIILAAACAFAQTNPATVPGASSSSKPAPKAGTQAKPAGPAKPAPPATPEPDDGSVQGNTYTSDYFHFRYQFPKHLEVQENFMQGQEDESKQSFVLLAAFGPSAEGNRREGVVVFADRSLPADSSEGNWLSGYIEHLRSVLASQGAEPVGSTREYSFAGLKFLRADFQRSGDNPAFQSVLVPAQPQRGYALAFQFISSTESQTNQLIESMNSLAFIGAKN